MIRPQDKVYKLRVSILQKLLVGLLVIAVFAACAGTLYYLTLNRIHQSISNILDRHVVLKSYANSLHLRKQFIYAGIRIR